MGGVYAIQYDFKFRLTMKNNFIKDALLIGICVFGFNQNSEAQSTYTISSDAKANGMKLSGTSSMHDWDMNAHVFAGEAQFDVKKQGDGEQITGLNSLTFSLPVVNLKSDKKGLDKNAYEALNTTLHKDIHYKLSSAIVSPEKDGKFLINAIGDLTIAGITREVTMDVYCLVNSNSTISCSGSNKLKMTDYKIEPPSFMFGAMKTGDGVTLNFTMVYEN